MLLSLLSSSDLSWVRFTSLTNCFGFPVYLPASSCVLSSRTLVVDICACKASLTRRISSLTLRGAIRVLSSRRLTWVGFRRRKDVGSPMRCLSEEFSWPCSVNGKALRRNRAISTSVITCLAISDLFCCGKLPANAEFVPRRPLSSTNFKFLLCNTNRSPLEGVHITKANQNPVSNARADLRTAETAICAILVERIWKSSSALWSYSFDQPINHCSALSKTL